MLIWESQGTHEKTTSVREVRIWTEQGKVTNISISGMLRGPKGGVQYGPVGFSPEEWNEINIALTAISSGIGNGAYELFEKGLYNGRLLKCNRHELLSDSIIESKYLAGHELRYHSDQPFSEIAKDEHHPKNYQSSDYVEQAREFDRQHPQLRDEGETKG